ncbi:sulfur carrier protein ThiS [Paucibacter soli]|uniref:sulfur carrier protein ThiS n=1 Tax=Paucibacter soli TaxID=3133433 RepID=UPI0030A0CA5C
MNSKIEVLMDEQALELPAGSSLAELLNELAHEPHSVATALNGQFVARDARPGTLLQDGDKVLLFKPIVGG